MKRKTVMKELVVIKKAVIGTEEVNSVNARELHSFLESKQDFSTWIKARIEKYGFVQGVDFIQFHNFVESDSKARIEYALTMDTAKELSMVENNEKGKEARKYFIQCEQKLKEVVQNKISPQWQIEADYVTKFLTQFHAPEHVVAIETAKFIHKSGGPDLRELTKVLPCCQNVQETEIYLEPTELGKHFNISGRNMNRELRDLELQYHNDIEWVATKQGLKYCQKGQWSSGDKTGYNLRWNLAEIKKLMK